MGSNQHQFVAVTKLENGEKLIIGSAGLSVDENPRTRHSGSIRNIRTWVLELL